MTPDEFWAVVDAARADSLLDDSALAAHIAALPPDGVLDIVGESYRDALIAVLAALTPERICEYAEAHARARARLYRWPLWGAGYLIGGGCSDDAFMDFRNGVLALGREWSERALAEPDSLAEHPLVAAAGARGDDAVLFWEDVGYAPALAFEASTGEGGDAFHRLMDARRPPVREPVGEVGGESWDFDDADETRERLPRLSAHFWPED
ncbi:DUF4240 domain-containing protein [Phytomonospora sp. NPDC050363]|uniref:DUF4240 domain-containing protein n=1 Tax=Phytomonospora sp. NPDC050363 TaxID=3155642 RepID=UPI0033DBFF7C